MTLKELSQLYYLNREIEMDKKRLQELEIMAVSISPNLTLPPSTKEVLLILRHTPAVPLSHI